MVESGDIMGNTDTVEINHFVYEYHEIVQRWPNITVLHDEYSHQIGGFLLQVKFCLFEGFIGNQLISIQGNPSNSHMHIHTHTHTHTHTNTYFEKLNSQPSYAHMPQISW